MADNVENKKALSPESSPNTMDIKTGRARRINNKPVLIACMVIVVVILTFVQVLIGRSNKANLENSPAAQRESCRQGQRYSL